MSRIVYNKAAISGQRNVVDWRTSVGGEGEGEDMRTFRMRINGESFIVEMEELVSADGVNPTVAMYPSQVAPSMLGAQGGGAPQYYVPGAAMTPSSMGQGQMGAGFPSVSQTPTGIGYASALQNLTGTGYAPLPQGAFGAPVAPVAQNQVATSSATAQNGGATASNGTAQESDAAASGEAVLSGTNQASAGASQAASAREAEATPGLGEGEEVVSPMPGTVVRIMKKVGDTVEEDEPVIIFEALKMENEIVAPKNGTITGIGVKEGDALNAGDALFTVQ